MGVQKAQPSLLPFRLMITVPGSSESADKYVPGFSLLVFLKKNSHFSCFRFNYFFESGLFRVFMGLSGIRKELQPVECRLPAFPVYPHIIFQFRFESNRNFIHYSFVDLRNIQEPDLVI